MRDTTRERFAKTAERIAALQDARAAELEAKVVSFVAPAGGERALDSGSGAGALAFALAPHVASSCFLGEVASPRQRRLEPVRTGILAEG
jgi:hypothetical protein